MIEWNKDTKKQSDSTSNYIQEMEAAVDNLCNELLKDSKKFEANVFFDRLHDYIIKEDRLLYTNITNYIFSLDKEEEFGIMQTNLDSVINYMYGNQFEIDHPWKEEASIIYKIDEIYYGLAPKIREMSNEYQKTKDEYILMEVWSQYAEDFGVMYKQMVELGDKVWDLAYPEGKKYRKIANKKKK